MEQAATARMARQEEIDQLNAQLDASGEKAAQAQADEEALTERIEARSEELNRLAEGDDAFLTRQRVLADQPPCPAGRKQERAGPAQRCLPGRDRGHPQS